MSTSSLLIMTSILNDVMTSARADVPTVSLILSSTQMDAQITNFVNS